MPFFSIVIPTYNRAHLIHKAVESVQAQSFDDFELIIVDDGSKDDTKKVIADFIDSDKRIHYIFQENGERGKARNNGVKHATGEYVFFLDSDDLLYPEHLFHAHTELTRLGHPEFFHIRYEEVHPSHKSQVPKLNHATIKAETLKQNQFACQFFLKHSIALKFPFSENRDLKIGEDWEVILKIAQRFPLHFSNEVHAAIVHHGERSMEVASADVILKSQEIILDNLEKDEKISTAILKNIRIELTSLAALSASIAGNKKNAFSLWRKAFKLNASILFRRRSMAIMKKLILGGQA